MAHTAECATQKTSKTLHDCTCEDWLGGPGLGIVAEEALGREGQTALFTVEIEHPIANAANAPGSPGH
jgi:hypothetical protein